MSVRGIMTSRTTVSSHSKIEWMSSRSSSSSTSSSVASSTMLSSCSSLENVADFGPPGRHAVAERDEAVGDRSEHDPDGAHDGRREHDDALAWARPTLRGLEPTSTNEVPVMTSALASEHPPPVVEDLGEDERHQHRGGRLRDDAHEVERR